uniref:Uncharacterized protein n=1 Tax=Angiostrongylus cantonensis TaxID=6313 RepID=A0A0K0D7C7_ANGCA
MEAAWITKNYGDDLYLRCTYTRIQVLDRRLAHASNKYKVRRQMAWTRRDKATHSTLSMTLDKNCSSEHATVEAQAVSAFSSTRVCP